MSRWNPQSVQQRFDDRFIPEPNSGCWLWTGEIDAYGYGSFYLPPIRARLAAGEGCASIGRSFGVSDAVIRHVKSGKTWRNV